MRLRHLHIHLVDGHEKDFWNLTDDFTHAVYRDKETGHKFSFPKIEGDLDPELIAAGCVYLRADIPNEVQEEIKRLNKENKENKDKDNEDNK